MGDWECAGNGNEGFGNVLGKGMQDLGMSRNLLEAGMGDFWDTGTPETLAWGNFGISRGGHGTSRTLGYPKRKVPTHVPSPQEYPRAFPGSLSLPESLEFPGIAMLYSGITFFWDGNVLGGVP